MREENRRKGNIIMYDDSNNQFPEMEPYKEATDERIDPVQETTPDPNFIMQDSRPAEEQSGSAAEPVLAAEVPEAERSHGQAGWEHRSRQRSPHSAPSGHSQSYHQQKKPSNAGRFAGVAIAAVLFGGLAGGTMFGVNTIGEVVKDRYMSQAQANRAETQAALAGETAAAAESDASTVGAPVVPTVQNDVSAIVEQAMPSVVAITNTMMIQQQTWFGQSQTVEMPSSGSGIIIGQNEDELLIVTNNHVVADSNTLTVTFIDDSQVNAAIKGTDPDSDLAVIAIALSDIPGETMSQIKVATLGDSEELKVGEGVIAIGNALGYGQSVTVGYVSAKDRSVTAEDQTTRDLLQTDAAINPGNSGGALLNMRGEVIGINAAKYSSTAIEGMGYAIPISKAQVIIDELMNLETRSLVAEENRGYLGIQGQTIDEAASSMYGMPRGVYVFKIVEGYAAEQSDLREKDIITKFDGRTVRSMQELQELLAFYEGGSTVTVTVQTLEQGTYAERQVDITLGNRPTAEAN